MRIALVALALLLSFGAAENAAAATAATHRHHTVAAQRTPDADAASVAHNFVVAHPEPFLRGWKDNHQLARIIRDNLAKDPSGNTRLDEVQCKSNGSCATPSRFLQSAQHDRPDMTLDKLADYIDSLKPHQLTAEEAAEQWDMDCLDRDNDYQVVIPCGNREFHKGEIAYVDPDTGKFEMAKDCANWVRGVHHEPPPLVVQTSPCAYVDAPIGQVDISRTAITGPPVPVDDECYPAILPPGEDDYLAEWFDECRDFRCTFEEDMAVTGRSIFLEGSYKAASSGRQRIRVPRSFMNPDSPNRVWLCLTRADGAESDVIEVEPTSYLKKDRVFVATVYPTQADVPQGAPMLYWPYGEYYGQ